MGGWEGYHTCHVQYFLKGHAVHVYLLPIFILYTDISLVGLALGPESLEFEVVLPNGQICPAPDHGIPTNGGGILMIKPLLAEARGVLYMCGGRFDSNSAITGM